MDIQSFYTAAWNSLYQSVHGTRRIPVLHFIHMAIHYLAPNMFDLCPFIDKYVLPRLLCLDYFQNFTVL